MAIVLCRVDDRLVHGQVVIGWGRPLGIDLIMLVDDTVAGSAWEQELYRMAVSPDIEIRFVTVAEASTQLPALSSDGRRALVLTGDLETMAALHTANPLAARMWFLHKSQYEILDTWDMAGLRGLLLTVYTGDDYVYRRHSKRAKSGAPIPDEDRIVQPHLLSQVPRQRRRPRRRPLRAAFVKPHILPRIRVQHPRRRRRDEIPVPREMVPVLRREI